MAGILEGRRVFTDHLFPLALLFLFFGMLPSFLKGRYRRKIHRAMKQQGFSDAQREQFAREQLNARCDPAKTIITQDRDGMPVQFTLSEHFACFTGGANFGPYILNLDRVESIQVSTNIIHLPVITRAAFLIIQADRNITTYVLHFWGQGQEQGCFQFGDPEIFTAVGAILCRRFPKRTGR